jgi:hypothetical protein
MSEYDGMDWEKRSMERSRSVTRRLAVQDPAKIAQENIAFRAERDALKSALDEEMEDVADARRRLGEVMAERDALREEVTRLGRLSPEGRGFSEWMEEQGYNALDDEFLERKIAEYVERRLEEARAALGVAEEAIDFSLGALWDGSEGMLDRAAALAVRRMAQDAHRKVKDVLARLSPEKRP